MDLPACLTDYIGITKDFCINSNTPPPLSGLYVTDLEGITLNLAAHIVAGEDVNGVNLIKQKINLATGLVIDDLEYYLQESFQLNMMKDYLVSGNFNEVYLPFANFERGLSITRNGNSSYYSIRLEKVQILTNTTKTGAILKIYDGSLVTQFTFDTVAGQIKEIQLDYDIKMNHVLLVMDNTDIEVNEGFLDNVTPTNNNFPCGCGCKSVQFQNSLNSPYNKFITVRGWDGLVEDNLIYGMKLEASIRCNFDRFVCALADKFKYIILYKVGILIAKEWIVSERLNRFTTVDAHKAEFLMYQWQDEYDRKYKSLVKGIDGLIKSVSDSDCVKCKGGGYFYQI